MAYISTEEVRAIRVALKDKFGPKGFKFGVKNSDKMKVIVTILSGPTNFDDIMGSVASNNYMQINQYHMFQYGTHMAFFKEIETIIKTAPATVNGGHGWYDNSDVQTDYFDVAYYYSMRIGDWDKPYVQKNEKKIPA